MDYLHESVIITTLLLRIFRLVSGDVQTHYLLDNNGKCAHSPLRLDLSGTGTSSVKVASQMQNLSASNPNGTVCKMSWNAQSGTRTLLRLTFVRNTTCDDRLEVVLLKTNKEYNLCGPNATDGRVIVLDFDGNLNMTYYTRLADTSNRWRFEALLTQYISLPIAGDCPQAFILCDTDRCMSKSLQKDGDRNCEDGTDEGDPSTTSSSTVSSTTSSTVSSTTSSTAVSVLSSTASSVLSSTASSVVSSTASSVLSSTASSVLSTPASPPLSTTTLLTSATNNTANEMSRFVAGLSGTQLMSAILVPIAIIICTVSSVVCFRRRAHSHYEDPALVPN